MNELFQPLVAQAPAAWGGGLSDGASGPSDGASGEFLSTLADFHATLNEAVSPAPPQ